MTQHRNLDRRVLRPYQCHRKEKAFDHRTSVLTEDGISTSLWLMSLGGRGKAMSAPGPVSVSNEEVDSGKPIDYRQYAYSSGGSLVDGSGTYRVYGIENSNATCIRGQDEMTSQGSMQCHT
jgi:hypothetical protein